MAWNSSRVDSTRDIKQESGENSHQLELDDTEDKVNKDTDHNQTPPLPQPEDNQVDNLDSVMASEPQPTTSDLSTSTPVNEPSQHNNINNNNKSSPDRQYVSFEGKRIKKMCMTCNYDFSDVKDQSKICLWCYGMMCARCLSKGKHKFHNKHLTTFGTVAKL